MLILSLRGATQSNRVPQPTPFSASGGTETTFGSYGYKYHIFEHPTSDNFVVASG